MNKLVVLADADGNECLYVNGKKAFSDRRIHAIDMALNSNGDPCLLFSHFYVRLGDDAVCWPETLDEFVAKYGPLPE